MILRPHNLSAPWTAAGTCYRGRRMLTGWRVVWYHWAESSPAHSNCKYSAHRYERWLLTTKHNAWCMWSVLLFTEAFFVHLLSSVIQFSAVSSVKSQFVSYLVITVWAIVVEVVSLYSLETYWCWALLLFSLFVCRTSTWGSTFALCLRGVSAARGTWWRLLSTKAHRWLWDGTPNVRMLYFSTTVWWTWYRTSGYIYVLISFPNFMEIILDITTDFLLSLFYNTYFLSVSVPHAELSALDLSNWAMM